MVPLIPTKLKEAAQSSFVKGSNRADRKMSVPDSNKSYLSTGIGGISSLSPWGSRSGTPKPPDTKEGTEAKEAVFGTQRANDHTVSRKNRFSLKRYPRDCPPVTVQWYHAVDVCVTGSQPNSG